MAEKKENKKSAAVEMYFSRNQTNGLMYVLDCFVKADNCFQFILLLFRKCLSSILIRLLKL